MTSSRRTCLRLSLAVILLCVSTGVTGEIGHQIVEQIDLDHYRRWRTRSG